jgi:hypothetical protein
MRVITNRVVREWNHRLSEVPATAQALAAQPESAAPCSVAKP